MNLTIRPVTIEDAPAIHAIRTMKGVKENTLNFTSGRITIFEEAIRNMTRNNHMLVAEVEDNGIKKVVGDITLDIDNTSRRRHTVLIGISIHTDYQGKGIGRALFNEMLDIADNWLMLVRLELHVFTDNEIAIKLYKSLGFEIEGVMKYSTIKNGKYADQYLMARYRNLLE